MAETKTMSNPVEPTPPRQVVKMRKFEAPAELAKEFGVIGQQEDHVHGFLKTEEIRKLLDAFGLQERTQIALPFQHMKKQHGEIWSMRIEPESVEIIDGQPVRGHAWTFIQQWPERVASAA